MYVLLCIGRQHKLPECIEINTLVAMVELEEADLATIKCDHECAIRQKMAGGNLSIGVPDSSITSLRQLGGDACNTFIFPANKAALNKRVEM